MGQRQAPSDWVTTQGPQDWIDSNSPAAKALIEKKSDAPDARTAREVAIDQMDAVSRGYLQPIKDLPDTAMSLAALPFMTPGERAQKVVAAVKSYAKPAITTARGALSGRKIVLPGMGGAIQLPEFAEGDPSSPAWQQAAEGAGANMTNTLATVAAVKGLQNAGAIGAAGKAVAANPATREVLIKALKGAGLVTGGGIGAEILRRLFPER